MSKRVSIIIPVFNQAYYTKQCLEKFYACTDSDSTELIVVDNHSTDETPGLLSSFGKAVTVITNTVNMGFASACNQGARAASSRNILFLNNDTEVQPGWLEPLVETLERDSGIGAVGSQLLYPDGRLQHAGVVIISQKETCSLLPRHVFMGENPANVPVDQPMCFQALTAACLILRKDDFDAIGGFDEAYWNGCEDVDLCFKLQQTGKKIVYQPESVVIHHESKSGQERMVAQPRNNARLRARWEQVILPDIIQEGLIARRGTSCAVMPLELGHPDPGYLEIAAAWWTNREIDAEIAKKDRVTIQLTEELNQSRQELVQLTEELNQSRQEHAQLTAEIEKNKTCAKVLEIRVVQLSSMNQRIVDYLRSLNNNFSLLLKSKRWQIGNAMVRFIEILLFRRKVMLASDHMKDIFNWFEKMQLQPSPDLDGCLNESKTGKVHEPVMVNPSTYVNTDIVICVHNALNDLKLCLDSVVKNTSAPYHLILVNDGSDVETTELLRQFVCRHPQCTLLENEKALGYTRAANQGLRVSTAEHVVLLNSDTLVPRLWMEALTECALSDSVIGIVGPLSNAASWQSVPTRFDPGGDWAVNELPDGYSVDEMAELVYQLSCRRFPRVTFVNGFCFLIKRSLIESIGLLDEEAFPAGYGEENDYCLRAAKAGFSLAIADHCYVYHAKSRSYSHERRIVLASQGGKALKKKHGGQIIDQGTSALRKQADLVELRQRIRDYMAGTGIKFATDQTNRLAICFVLPAGGIGGGILSVVQEACGMSRLGHDVHILTRERYRNNFTRFFPDLIHDGNLFTFYEDDQEFLSWAAQADVLFATTWDSPRLIATVVKQNPRILPAYYIQDYEPWFFPENSEERQVAIESYSLIPDMLYIAKTYWLCRTLEMMQGISVTKVSPGLDRKIFFPPAHDAVQQKTPMAIVAMIRPDSPRRGAERTLRVLKKIQNLFTPIVRIHVFGCNDAEIQPLEHDFSFHNHGVLKREEVATLYRESTLFVDFSDYQAFGRTGLEAMACGCVPVLPSEGGVYEYAEDQKNALIVDTGNEDQLVEVLSSLVVSDSLRWNMRQAALKTAARFSVERAVLSELGAIRQSLEKHRHHRSCSAEIIMDVWNAPGKVKIALLLALRGDGKPCGSGHIRLLNPLSHPSVADRVATRMVSPSEALRLKPDILVVQRASVPDPVTARQIITHCRSRSIRLVLEIDDDLLNLHHKTGNDVSYAEDYLKALEEIARNADGIMVSSMPLAESMRKFNPRVVCVPNVHDELIWLKKSSGRFVRPLKKLNSQQVRILYMGTKTHEHDLKLIQQAYTRIRQEYGKRVELEIVGGIPDHITGFGRQVKPWGIGANSDAYCEFVHWFRKTNHWDFGVIPLELTPFNRKKSYIKFLDYAAIGVSAICSDIEPYREVVRDGENGLLVTNDTQAWYLAMKRLIDNPDLREKLAENAFRDLTEKHILLHRAKDFLGAIAGDRLTNGVSLGTRQGTL
jgi:GT2 family glycosyltransferase/glycosyltransferase involved in cell wall biosynthesis